MNEVNKQRIIGRWLMIGVGMLMVQVLLGGITRLTGSGLSVTEWNPIMGFIPPLNTEEWNVAFEKYKQIGQYKFLNSDFTLSDFKFIYFWEWFHRVWARCIGGVFLLPFIWLLIKKYVNRQMIIALAFLFVLGMAQGLIGWIMVASGLNEDNLYVNPIKLTAHFISAMVLISFTFWYALKWLIHEEERMDNPRLRRMNIVLILLLTLQLAYGGFMAGGKAGGAAATWPDINGYYWPEKWWSYSFIHNPITVHMIHRGLAYILCLAVLYVFFQGRKETTSSTWKKYYGLPLFFTFLQVTLGVITVLNANHVSRNDFGMFEYFAQAHQLTAMLLAMSLVWSVFMTSRPRLPSST